MEPPVLPTPPAINQPAPERPARKARLVVVDDHPLFREGLREVIRRELDLELVADLGNGLDLLELAARGPLDLAVIDVVMPSTNGLTLTAALRRMQPRCRILALSALEDPTRIAELLRAGAHGFACKSQPPSAIVAAIRAVLAGQRYLPDAAPADTIATLVERDDAWPLRRLTPRERQIFDLLVAGASNDAVAEQLVIARRTVETHRQHIMKKVGARSLVELIRIGVKFGVPTTLSS